MKLKALVLQLDETIFMLVFLSQGRLLFDYAACDLSAASAQVPCCR